MDSETKQCQNCKKDFIIEPDDFAFYKKMKVPSPTFCPSCRLQRRMAWRNEKSLYRRNCDKCKKSIISVFSTDSGLMVYCPSCWWSDKWDPIDYGTEYDISRPFITQLRELLQRTPVMALFGYYNTLENSDYTNMVGYLKNCYLITNADHDENCLYGSDIIFCKDCVDNAMLTKSELCYENLNCRECYRTIYSVNCESCSGVAFSKNCIGCSDCIGCINLRSKKYCIFNEQFSKEEYDKKAAELLANSREKIDQIKYEAFSFWQKFPHKYMYGRHNQNVSGDYIFKSKNVKDSFSVQGGENCRYCSIITVPTIANCYDFSHYGENCELVYEALQVGDQASRILFTWFGTNGCQEIEYSMFTTGCRNIFGSVSLKKKEYCILNKQYSKKDFEELRARIIEDMYTNPYKDENGKTYAYGEFFPIEMSPFGYNATTAQEDFPLTKEEILKLHYKWKEPEKNEYAVTITPVQLPDSSDQISDTYVKEVIGCKHNGQCNHRCSGAFRLTAAEINFYKKMNLPLPALCSNCRHYERLSLRNPKKLWHRQCMCDKQHPHHTGKCPNEFETSYAPDRKEIVYCEECYQTEVS